MTISSEIYMYSIFFTIHLSYLKDSTQTRNKTFKNRLFKLRMPRLRDTQRHQAIGMVAAGLSFREIARRMGCSHQTIMKLARRHEDTGSVCDRPRPGRERVTSVRTDRQIVLTHLRYRFRAATQTARETPGIRNDRISASTVRRRLKHVDMRARYAYRGNVLTPERRRNRVNWCTLHQRWTQRQWNGVLFTDESRFCLDMSDRRKMVWRRRGERYADCCVRQAMRWGGGSVMVWGGISWRHKTPLVVLDGTLTAQRYVDNVLRPFVLPFVRNHDDVNVVQQDNARPHSARVTQEFLRENNIRILPWPAFSPDLNPIEHFWDQLGRKVYDGRRQISNRQQLVQALIEEWDAIPQYRIQRLIQSMRRRCHAVLNVQGGHTRY